MKRNRREPYLKFFCSDWRADVALRRCSFAARGLWVDMITIMHDAEPYGELRDAGQPLDVPDLVQLLGGSPAEIKKMLAELEARGVFSRSEADGCIYSRRMKRDHSKAERDRENGSIGGNPSLKGGVNPTEPPPVNPKGTNGVNHPDNPGDKAHADAPAPDHFHSQKKESPSLLAFGKNEREEESQKGKEEGIEIPISQGVEAHAEPAPKPANVVPIRQTPSLPPVLEKPPVGPVRTPNEQRDAVETKTVRKAAQITPEQLEQIRRSSSLYPPGSMFGPKAKP